MPRLTEREKRQNKIDRRAAKLAEWMPGKQINKSASRFQEMIRLRSAVEYQNGGRYRCCYCRQWVRWDTLDANACHFHTRKNKSTIFDPMNCHGGCAGCNQRGDHGLYVKFMEARYSPEQLADLLIRTNTPRDPFTKWELAELYVDWGYEIKRLTEQLEQMT